MAGQLYCLKTLRLQPNHQNKRFLKNHNLTGALMHPEWQLFMPCCVCRVLAAGMTRICRCKPCLYGPLQSMNSDWSLRLSPRRRNHAINHGKTGPFHAASCRQRQYGLTTLIKQRFAKLPLQCLKLVGKLGPPYQSHQMELHRYCASSSTSISPCDWKPGRFHTGRKRCWRPGRSHGQNVFTLNP